MFKPGNRVASGYIDTLNWHGVVSTPPFKLYGSTKHWNRHFAWVKWDNGTESSELTRYLTLEE